MVSVVLDALSMKGLVANRAAAIAHFWISHTVGSLIRGTSRLDHCSRPGGNFLNLAQLTRMPVFDRNVQLGVAKARNA
jgi:hypothetical protein